MFKIIIICFSLNVFAVPELTNKQAIQLASDIQKKAVRTNTDNNDMKRALKRIIKNSFPEAPNR
jgi:hypothetical protein